MAFCNSCGAPLAPGTKFCNKCGNAVSAAPSAGAPAPVPFAPVASAPVASTPTPPPPTAAQKGGSSALKIILIVVAVIVVIGVLGLATLGIIAYKVAKSSHVTQDGEHVKLETPFGKIEGSSDPEQAAKDIGVDIYPGAEVQKAGSGSATLGSMHTVTANFESSDSVDKVCAFYKSKFPAATVKSSDQNRCTIVSGDQTNMITINVEANGDASKFQIVNVNKKASN